MAAAAAATAAIVAATTAAEPATDAAAIDGLMIQQGDGSINMLVGPQWCSDG